MVRRALALLALFGASATALAELTTQVRDWFVMTDELLYERLAVEVARTGSPLPQLHGVHVPSLAQLYPVLISPFFVHGTVAHDLPGAKLANAWIMASACIPAYLLARRVTGRTATAFAAAALTVLVPWMLYASFLLTEVSAYPAFLWCMLALQAAAARPSRRNDLLAIASLALAFFARTQFVLVIVLFPLALVLVDGRAAVRRHRVLTTAYALLAVAVAAVAAAGRVSSLFGVYGSTVGGGIPPGTAKWLTEHLALLALGLGIVPFLIGAAWLLANVVRPPVDLERRAFAALALLVTAGLVLEVTVYDLRVGAGAVFDRYLFYAAPLLLIAALLAVLDTWRPRLSLVIPAALVTVGFAVAIPPAYTWSQFPMIDPNTPVSALYRLLVPHLHGGTTVRVVLAGVAVGGAAALALLPRRAALAVVAASLVVPPFATAYAFHRLFATNGWSLRAVTASESAFAWIDQRIGPAPRVTMIPYPISSNYFSSEQRWRDVEFWNKSLAREAQPRTGGFVYTGNAFPRLTLDYDRSTGAVSISPTRYVAQSDKETRFRIAGPAIGLAQDVMLIDAGSRWRLDWVTSGFWDDGWTREGVPGVIRIFSFPGQHGPRLRSLSLAVHAPVNIPARVFRVVSNVAHWQATATNTTTALGSVAVCVPAKGFAEVRVLVHDHSWALGSIDSLAESFRSRRVGVGFGAIAVADEVGGACAP